MQRKIRKPPVVKRPVERVEPKPVVKTVKPGEKRTTMSDAITRAWNERGLI
jgi:hypothetical protein